MEQKLQRYEFKQWKIVVLIKNKISVVELVTMYVKKKELCFRSQIQCLSLEWYCYSCLLEVSYYHFLAKSAWNMLHEIWNICMMQQINIFQRNRAHYETRNVCFLKYVYFFEKRDQVADPRKQDIATLWRKGQNIQFSDFYWF